VNLTDVVRDHPNFAPGVLRTPEGWIDWPADTPFRKEHFPVAGLGHPAKANLHMLVDLMHFLTKEGESIMDPFGGVGSMLIATLFGRHVILIDVEDGYHELEKEAWKELQPGATGNAVILLGDNRLVMPFSCDHIITSPPYSNVLASPYSTLRAQAEKDTERAEVLSGYSENSPGNLGMLPVFQYNQQMERVYRGMAQSVRVGGTVTVLIKDFFVKGERNYLSAWVDRTFRGFGNMELAYWFKRKTRGLSSNDRKSRGLEAIEDEDLMVYRRTQ
jgi:DNA modification methylase